MLRFDFIYLLAGLLASPWLVFERLRTGTWPLGLPSRTRAPGALLPAPGPVILLHAVSVGEASALRSLASILAADLSSPRIVISTTTDTGFVRARTLFGAEHTVVRLPLDFSWLVRRFLEAIRPDVMVLVELEVWPNLMHACARGGIPVSVVNGRVTEKSLRSYGMLGGLLRPAFRTIAAVGAQTEEYAARFVALGVPPDRIRITDTMKWDNVASTVAPGTEELARRLGIDRSRPLVVAGSTGPGEERALIDARPEGVQLLLVPRKPERFDEVAALDPAMVRWSARRAGANGASSASDLYLLDTMGKLDDAYGLADIALIGRSFEPQGGSDPIPSVALGVPTIIGPFHHNFRHVVAELELEGGIEVSSDPMKTAAQLLESAEVMERMASRGRGIVRRHQGASRRTADLIMETLAQYSS